MYEAVRTDLYMKLHTELGRYGLDRNMILYTIALREQWCGNSLKLLSSFCKASIISRT